jgi:modulator of FtsH protease HflK
MSSELEQTIDLNGRDPNGPQPAAGPSAFRKWAKGIAFLLVCLLLLGGVIMTSVYNVPAGHNGVVLRLGRYAGTAGPGLRLKIPFGVDRVVDLESGKVQTESFGFRNMNPGIGGRHVKDSSSSRESLMLTGDLSIIGLEWTVQYACRDAEKFLFAVHDPFQAVRDAGEESMRFAVGGASLDFVLQNRDELERICRDRLQSTLDSLGSGIAVVEVRIQDVVPPEPVKAAFDEVIAAQQEKDSLIQQALAEYNREIPKARGEGKGLVSASEGYALERVNRARGEASRFSDMLREYRGAREVTRKRLYLETCREVMPKAHQVIVVDGRHKDLIPRLNPDKAAPSSGGGK